MIKTLEIQNFKSIKQLKLDCKKINIFIGKPNTGKSNILESMGLFSFAAYYGYGDLHNFIRYERMSNLFYDEHIEDPIVVRYGDFTLTMIFRPGQFLYEINQAERSLAYFSGDYNSLSAHSVETGLLHLFKTYNFSIQRVFQQTQAEFLLPPSGANLMALMLAKKELRVLANEIFQNYGLRLGLRPQENKIEVIKQLDDIIVSYPYSLTSDTLQRIIFHLFAVISNKDSVITFEEPESHAFPYYTKYLAEKIALDSQGNQYFITTHNPYFLLPVLEKAPQDAVNVFITYYEDYQTKVKALTTAELAKIMEMDADVFFNIDSFLGDK